MSRYDAVLFDMDGTLLDTIDDIQDALNHTLAEHEYPTHSKDAVKSFVGNGAYKLLERALPAFTEKATVGSLMNAYQRQYTQRMGEKTRPFQGVLPMLTALDEAGLKLAIISNKGDADVKQLTKEHFGSLIHVAVGARESVPLKPAPDMLHIAMEKLGLTPERTLYIGDAPTDFEAAGNAGMDCILARWGYGDSTAMAMLNPLYFAAEPDELPMLILQGQEDFS